MESKAFIDKIEYYIDNPNDEEYFNTMFTAQERDILRGIRDFERNRYMMRMEEMSSSDRSRAAEEVFRSMEQEREISFWLKERIDAHMNFLLGEERIDAWVEVLTWYRLLDGKGIIVNRFWEFPILGTMLKAFMRELDLHYRKGSPISILNIHNMEELTETYFKIVFLLRRIEYDVEPADESLCELAERKISPAAVKAVLEDARISHREKVRKVIEDWEERVDG